VTELFFESAEPSFADLPLDQLLLRFPQGNYRFEGVTVAGARLAGMATLSHTIPAGPKVVAPAEGATLAPNAPVVIDWNPVTQPFPGNDRSGHDRRLPGHRRTQTAASPRSRSV
jgi:hypothetical protein